jgi:Family of unknown function (DUF5947)
MTPSPTNTLGALRRFVRRNRPLERCELCGTDLAPDHPHLLEPHARKLVCACGACAVLFAAQGGARYKRVPRRVRFLRNFGLTDAQWEGLLIPINVAFFFESSPANRVVALYPSPAGAPESQLPLNTWSEIVEANPVLEEMEADVEALLVNRLGPIRGYPAPEYYLLPIDECYRLAGLIRAHWRGFSGGSEVWEQLRIFFDGLKDRAGATAGAHYA